MHWCIICSHRWQQADWFCMENARVHLLRQKKSKKATESHCSAANITHIHIEYILFLYAKIMLISINLINHHRIWVRYLTKWAMFQCINLACIDDCWGCHRICRRKLFRAYLRINLLKSNLITFWQISFIIVAMASHTCFHYTMPKHTSIYLSVWWTAIYEGERWNENTKNKRWVPAIKRWIVDVAAPVCHSRVLQLQCRHLTVIEMILMTCVLHHFEKNAHNTKFIRNNLIWGTYRKFFELTVARCESSVGVCLFVMWLLLLLLVLLPLPPIAINCDLVVDNNVSIVLKCSCCCLIYKLFSSVICSGSTFLCVALTKIFICKKK